MSISPVLFVVVVGWCDPIASFTEENIRMEKTIRIQKGQDFFLEVTSLAEYAQQSGWMVTSETVEIVLPTGKELE
jgi:hypothetical protein